MKKSIALVTLTLILVMVVATASAVSLVSGTSAATSVAITTGMEQASFLVAKSGRICGVTSPSEDVELLAITEVANNLSSRAFAYIDGRMIREKAFHAATLDADNRIATGGSSLMVSLEVVDNFELSSRGLSTANDIVDATIVATVGANGTYMAAHRFATTVNKPREVARIHFEGHKGYASIVVCDWDGDGSEELCLRAGTASSSHGSSGGSSGSGSSGSGSSGGSSSGSSGGSSGGSSSSSEPNPHYRDW